MKRWSLITVLIGLLILASLIMIRVNAPITLPKVLNNDIPAKNTPSEKAVPKGVAELRQQHHLRPLTELEDGTKAQELPKGVYGFSTCGVVSLSTKRDQTLSLEIHKHDDGILYYVGYASDEHIAKYLAREKNFHILMSPYPQEKTSSLLIIPVDFISKCEVRSLRDDYLFDLFIVSIPELQS